MKLKYLLVLLALPLGGCTWMTNWFAGKDNSEPPTPLTEVAAKIDVQQMWSHSVGHGGEERRLGLRPAVAGDLVYAAGREGDVTAVNLKTGKQAWRTKTKAAVSAGPGYGDGLVFVGTTDARVLALRADTGEKAWEAEVSSEVLSPPQSESGVTVVHTIDGRVAGLSASDGKRLWIYDRNAPVLTLRGTSMPALQQGVAVTGFDGGQIAALALSDGRPLWERSVAIPSGRSELERLVDIDADPVISDGVVYVTTYQGRIAALALNTGQLLWAREMSSYAGLDVGPTQVFVTDDTGQVWALDRRTGATFWKQDKLRYRRVSRPAVIGDYVVVGDFEGYLHWLSQDDGHIVARTRAQDSGISAPPLTVAGELLVLTNDGELSAWHVNGATRQ